MEPMAGRTVLITGATSGIGRATALGLARMGAHLAITGRDRVRTEDAAREIGAVGGTSMGADDPARIQKLLVRVLRPLMKSPARGAATSTHVASAPELAQVTGRYFANSKPKKSSERSYDQAAAARLWQVSAELVGLSTAADTPSRPPFAPKI
jgi:short chain dehydrogenase